MRNRVIAGMLVGRIALFSDRAKIVFLQRAPFYCQDEDDATSIYSHDAAGSCVDISLVIAGLMTQLFACSTSTNSGVPSCDPFTTYVGDDRLICLRSSFSEGELKHHFLLHIAHVGASDLAGEQSQLGL